MLTVEWFSPFQMLSSWLYAQTMDTLNTAYSRQNTRRISLEKVNVLAWPEHFLDPEA